MKKLLLGFIFILSGYSYAIAEHIVPRNASNLTVGTLPNARLDPSSATMRGNTPLLPDAPGVVFSSHIAGGAIGGGSLGNEVIFPTNTARGEFLLNGEGVVSSTNVQNNTFLSQGTGVVFSSNAKTGVSGGLLANSLGVVAATNTITGKSGGLIENGLGVLSSTNALTGVSGGLMEVAIGVIVSSHILDGQIVDGDIAINTITGGKILDGTIGSADVANKAFAADKIQTGISGTLLPDEIGVVASSHVANNTFIQQGNNVIFSSHVSAGAGSLHASTFTLTTTGGNTNYLNIDSSTQTKEGGLILVGAFHASSATFNSTVTIMDLLRVSTITDGAEGRLFIDAKTLILGATFNWNGETIINSPEVIMPSSGAILQVGGPTSGTRGRVRTGELAGYDGDVHILFDATDASKISATTIVRGPLRPQNRVIISADGVSHTSYTHELKVIGSGEFSSSVTAQSFHGDGSGLTGVTVDSPHPYTLIVGTRGATGVHTTVENLAQWNIVLSSVGLGNPFSSTATATIFFKNGSYPLSGSTWPAGLTAIFDSTAVIVQNGAANSQLASVYGHLVRPNFDFSNKAFTVPQVFVGSFAWVEEPTTYGGSQAPSGPTALKWASQFFVGLASVPVVSTNTPLNELVNVIVGARITNIFAKDARAMGGIVSYGDAAAFIAHQTSGCYISFRKLTASKEAGATHTMMGIFKSTGLIVDVGVWENLGSNGIIVQDGSIDVQVRNFDMYVSRSGWDQALIGTIDAGVALDVGTGTWITNGRFHVAGTLPGGGASLINVNNSTVFTHALNISNVTATAPDTSNSITFIKLNAKSKNTVILNSSSSNIPTGLNDSGIGTVKTGLYKDGVTQ